MNKYIVPFMLIALIWIIIFVNGAPVGPSLESSSTDSPTARSALVMNTSGGTVTTMVLNGTTQNNQWKAYVGNVTGDLALRDSDNYTIFDWQFASVTGEVYATRKSTAVTWSSIACAQLADLGTEESALNIGAAEIDSIRNTFQNVTHDTFYAGTVNFPANECNYTVTTYVSSAPQDTDFQEVVLHDGSNVVYSAIIDAGTAGYNDEDFDFQMIVPEDPTSSKNHAYYFYVELS